MNSAVKAQAFVDGLSRLAMDEIIPQILRILEDPPGRAPNIELVWISSWFHQLSEEERSTFVDALRMAAKSVLFSVLAVLDGVSSPLSGFSSSGEFQLLWVDKQVRVQLTNSGDGLLHDLL
jgi:hypothetical protein